MQIRWKTGYRSSSDPAKVYSELERIRKRNGDLTPEAVVDSARSARSTMHNDFEWDDTVAANEHRLTQARTLLRSIEMRQADSPQIPTRVYEVVTRPPVKDQPARKVYTDTREAMADPVLRDEILGNAIRDAIAFRRKYAALQQLSQVHAAMDSFIASAG